MAMILDLLADFIIGLSMVAVLAALAALLWLVGGLPVLGLWAWGGALLWAACRKGPR